MTALVRSLRQIARLGVLLGLPPLLLALLVPIDALRPPAEPPYLELLASRAETFRFHLGLMLVGCTAVLLLLRGWRFAALGTALAAWALVPALRWPSVHRVPLPDAPAMRVLSINLGNDRARKDLVLQEIQRWQADVVLLQEYTPVWRDHLAQRLTARYPFREEKPQADNFGMAVLSAVAWTRIETFELDSPGPPQFRIELPLGGQPVVLYALHLLPPVGKLYGRHRAEFADLARRVAAEERPTLLAGDFNFVDHGALGGALHELGFFDAHGIAGHGRGATWPGDGPLRHVPGIRIDHVYVGRGLTATHAAVGARNGSDHLPTGATIVLARP